MSWPQIGALLSFCLAVVALLLLAIAPVGWRAGWWHFRFAFAWLMTSSGFAAAAAAIVSLLVLLFGGSHLEAGSLAMAAAALVVGAVLVYIPWQYNRLRNTVPRIHDITTDVENPPEFAAVLPARAAENAATADYEGAELAKLQRAAYPDVAPLELALTPGERLRSGACRGTVDAGLEHRRRRSCDRPHRGQSDEPMVRLHRRHRHPSLRPWPGKPRRHALAQSPGAQRLRRQRRTHPRIHERAAETLGLDLVGAGLLNRPSAGPQPSARRPRPA